MLALAAMGIHWLRDNTYVCDSRLLNRVHDGRECAERDVFVGAQINRLMLRVSDLLLDAGSDLIDVDRIVAEKNSL
jgi:hypothetical protein